MASRLSNLIFDCHIATLTSPSTYKINIPTNPQLNVRKLGLIFKTAVLLRKGIENSRKSKRFIVVFR